MANNTPSNVKGAIKTAAKTPPQTKDTSLRSLVERMSKEITKALPSTISPDRFIRMVLTALSNDPKLQECTPNSFLGAMMMAAQLGLEVNTPLGQAYLIPYRNKGVMECQLQLGYKGLLTLAYRSGQMSTIQAHTVYEKDEFDYCYGLNPDLTHVPYKGQDRGDPIYFYAVFHTKDGGFGFDVMTVDEVKEHARKYSRSSSGKYSPWTTNFESMALKTVLKRALKYAPISAELAREVATDETIKSVPSTSPSLIEDVDVVDLPDEFDYEFAAEIDDETIVEEEVFTPESNSQEQIKM